MNKKIFTLLASSLMLFLTAIVMNAQAPGYYGSDVKNLPGGMGVGAYHLKVSSIGLTPVAPTDANAHLLAMDEDGDLFWTDSKADIASYADLRAALWCVNITQFYDQGKPSVYEFINKQFQTLLAVDTGRWLRDLGPASFDGSLIKTQHSGYDGYVQTGGTNYKWEFSDPFEKDLLKDKPLIIEIDGEEDYFLTFAQDKNNGGGLALVKVHANDLLPGSAFNDNFLVRFTLVNAAPRVLTASDFNTALQSNPNGKFSQLFFKPDVKGSGLVNELAKKLYAVASPRNNPLLADNANYYMNFADKNPLDNVKDEKWVYVADGRKDADKAANYYNDYSDLYPIIKGDGNNNLDKADGGIDMEGDFRLVYYPSADSVIINVRGINHYNPLIGNTGTPGLALDNEGYGGTVEWPFNREIWDFLVVTLQDLHSKMDQRVLTVGAKPAYTRIYFGNNNCEVADDRTTVPRDLYVIRDSLGRYLVMPLETGDYTPRWMDLRENEDPMKTPSYQWLVYPMNEDSPTSQIILTNREFNWVQLQGVQVYKTAPGRTFWARYVQLYGAQFTTRELVNDVDAFIYYSDEVTGAPYLDKAEKGLKWNLAEGWKGSFLRVQDDLKAAAKKETKTELTQDDMQKLYRTSPYIGYKFIALDTLNYYTYSFNYLHKFSSDYYLGVKNDPKDTTVYVTPRRNFFRLEIPQQLRNYYGKQYTDGYYYGTEKYGIGWVDKLLDHPETADIAPLERYFYHFMENDYWNFLFNDNYIVLDSNGRYGFTNEYAANTRPLEAAVFYLRFTYQPQGKPEYYSMIERVYQSTWLKYADILGLQIQPTLKILDDSHGGYTVSGKDTLGVMVLGIDQMNLYARTQVKAVGVNPVSTFAISHDMEPLYRRFNEGVYPGMDGSHADDGGVAGNDDPRVIKISRSNNYKVDYLYENQHGRNAELSCIHCPPYNHEMNNGINFLGMENIFDHEAAVSADPNHAALGHNYAIYLDTAYVNRGTGTIKPQYLLVMDPKINQEWYCTNCEIVSGDYVYGRYLINATDSAWYKDSNGRALYGVASQVRDNAYLWNTKWERLAFVPAVHVRDTLFILNGHQIEDFFYTIPGTQERALHLSLLSTAAHDGKHNVEAIYLGNNYHKDVVFSMRFVEQGNYEDFLLESETTNRDSLTGRMIAPMMGGWVKMQNNEVVISRGSYVDAIREAGMWNTEPTTDAPVANDQVAVTAVKVIAGQGNVSILNAAGKQVTISNILGQTVASAVLTSDNATINAPKGVLVVAVEGENAVKAVVK